MNQLTNRTFAAACVRIRAVRNISIEIFRNRDLRCQGTPGFWHFNIFLAKNDLPAVISDLRNAAIPFYLIKRRTAFLAEKALKFQTALLLARTRSPHGGLKSLARTPVFNLIIEGAFFLKFALRQQ